MMTKTKEQKIEYVYVNIRFEKDDPLLRRVDLACKEKSLNRAHIFKDGAHEWLEARGIQLEHEK